MHAGRIDRDTAAGRVYRVLAGSPGRWWGGMELTLEARVTEVSTRISEVRHQLKHHGNTEWIQRHTVGRRNYYRLMTNTDGQVDDLWEMLDLPKMGEQLEF